MIKWAFSSLPPQSSVSKSRFPGATCAPWGDLRPSSDIKPVELCGRGLFGMRVTVPVETPVYFRRCARERYVLRHVSRSGYVRHMPLSLSVSDLRGQLVCEEQRMERENVPVLVLLTGKRALVYTLGNWSCPKKAVVLGPSEFSKGFAPVGGGELVESHFLLRSYTHLTTYCVRQGRYLPRDSSFFEAAGEFVIHLL